MIKLAETGALCECGSNRLAPTGDLALGDVCICAACARTYCLLSDLRAPTRGAVELVAVPWRVVERALEQRPHDLAAFKATWYAVSPARREAAINPVSAVIGGSRESVLAELERRMQRMQRAENVAVGLFVCFVVIAVALILKAVH